MSFCVFPRVITSRKVRRSTILENSRLPHTNAFSIAQDLGRSKGSANRRNLFRTPTVETKFQRIMKHFRKNIVKAVRFNSLVADLLLGHLIIDSMDNIEGANHIPLSAVNSGSSGVGTREFYHDKLLAFGFPEQGLNGIIEEFLIGKEATNQPRPISVGVEFTTNQQTGGGNIGISSISDSLARSTIVERKIIATCEGNGKFSKVNLSGNKSRFIDQPVQYDK